MATLGNPQNTIAILNKYGFNFQKKFGQNFLIDTHVLEKIIRAANITKDDFIVEIGPGIGALTEKILLTSNGDLQYTAVEIDKGLASYLENDSFIGMNALIVCSDYLKLDREDYVNYYDFDFVVSNIPYYVMTPIIKKLLVDCGTAEKMTFMVEQDAIERIIAKPKTKQYGPLAVLCAVYGTVRKEFSVGPENFYPAPHTMSAVITLTKKIFLNENDNFLITPLFEMFVEGCFAMRRKTLCNNLNSYFGSMKPNISFLEALEKMGLNPKVRAEDLNPDDFVELFTLLLL